MRPAITFLNIQLSNSRVVGDKTIHHRIGLHFRGRNLHFRKIAVFSICTSICSVLKYTLVLTNQRTKIYRRKCTDWEWKK